MSSLISTLTELEAILSIQTLVIQSNTGISLYERQFHGNETNPLLLSGLSTALSYMLDTVSEVEKKGFEHFNNKELYFVRHNLANSTFVIVSTIDLPKAILKQIERAHRKINFQYSSYFEGTRQGYDPLPEDEVEKIFNRFEFKLGLLGQLQINENEIPRLLQEEDGQTLIRYYMTHILDFQRDILADKSVFTVQELETYLQSKSLTSNVVANIIIKSWKVNAFLSSFT